MDIMRYVKPILGTMTFGPQADLQVSRAMVQRFLAAGHCELDTAYAYNGGDTESMLGTILREFPADTFHLATKVHPRISGKLDAAAVAMQLGESLRRLGLNSVDILYFHFPDPVTPVEEALETCTNLFRQGKIKELGLSNYPAWMVVDIWHLCKEHGWLQPSVYQGMYNGLTRSAEAELFSALRKLGIRFYAFNPLAGGMLTGKHMHYEKEPMPGRFARLQSYRNRYWKESYFKAVRVLAETSRKEGVEPAEAAYRWLTRHSLLDADEGDGIIVGASSLDQLDFNLAAVSKGSLPESVLNAFDDAWEEAKPDCPSYFRYHTQ